MDQREANQREDPLEELVKEQVDRTARQVLKAIATEVGRLARRHVAAAGTGASVGLAAWTYPVSAVPLAIGLLTYWVIASK